MEEELDTEEKEYVCFDAALFSDDKYNGDKALQEYYFIWHLDK